MTLTNAYEVIVRTLLVGINNDQQYAEVKSVLELFATNAAWATSKEGIAAELEEVKFLLDDYESTYKSES